MSTSMFGMRRTQGHAGDASPAARMCTAMNDSAPLSKHSRNHSVSKRKRRMSRIKAPVQTSVVHDLPREVLVNIALTLELDGIVAMARVCSRWHDILNSNPSLWHVIRIPIHLAVRRDPPRRRASQRVLCARPPLAPRDGARAPTGRTPRPAGRRC